MRIIAKKVGRDFKQARLSPNEIMNLSLMAVKNGDLAVEEAAIFMWDYERRQREKLQGGS